MAVPPVTIERTDRAECVVTHRAVTLHRGRCDASTVEQAHYIPPDRDNRTVPAPHAMEKRAPPHGTLIPHMGRVNTSAVRRLLIRGSLRPSVALANQVGNGTLCLGNACRQIIDLRGYLGNPVRRRVLDVGGMRVDIGRYLCQVSIVDSRL